MKIPALLTFLVAAVLSALPVSHARADSDVSFDVFYDSLGDQGDWYNTKEYGYVWQPSIAYNNDKWRPYSDGYWAQTDDGWTWVSYENFGWATYHYGRWTNLEDTGWVWVPGYEWGPGWVSWRTNDEYVGWAPLPPRRESRTHGGGGSSLTVDYTTVEPEEGYNDDVDEQYDIGPDRYCFVENRYFGAPVLREVIVPRQRNIVIIENTINVTNITYRRGGPRVVVINRGPDFDFLSRRSERPIQRLRIDRRDDIGFLRNSPHDRNPNVVRDGVFQIAAPNINRRPADFNLVKPPTIKRDIRDPRVEHGWRNTGADQTTVDRVRTQFQQQAREHPTRPPGNPAANLVPPADPRQRERDARTNVVPTPPTVPGAPNVTPPVDPRQRGRDGRTNIVPTPGASAAPTAPLPRGNSDEARRARRDAAQREKEARDTARTNGGQPTPPTAPDATPGDRPTAPTRNRPGQPKVDPNTVPKAPDATQEPTAPAEGNPNRNGRRNNPRQPAATPAAAPREDRATPPPAEPKATPPARSTEETARPPRHPERVRPEATPAREVAPETAPERRPQRSQEPPQRPQAPPATPRQEVREQPQPRQQVREQPQPRQEVREQPRQQVREQPQPQPRQEVREQPQPRQQVREQPQPQAQPRQQPPAAAPRQENRPPPQPAATADDDKKKRQN